jgi:CheY-like chemotaxis protein
MDKLKNKLKNIFKPKEKPHEGDHRNIDIKADQPKKILRNLIVDDSDINRLVMKKYLSRIKEQCIDTNSGIEAIKMLHEYDITFIWIDIRMPGMNGIDVTKEIKKMGYKGHIIGITGQVDAETQVDCLQAGMTLILAKPILPRTIYDVINKYSGTNY